MDKPKILHLTLKRKYFGLIHSGKKKVEYRLGTSYWKNRLLGKDSGYVDFDEIWFYNGGYFDSRRFPFMRVQWGGIFLNDISDVFHIQLGDILETKNWKYLQEFYG